MYAEACSGGTIAVVFDLLERGDCMVRTYRQYRQDSKSLRHYQSTYYFKRAPLIDRQANQALGRVEDRPKTTAALNEVASVRHGLVPLSHVAMHRYLVFHTLPR